MKNITTFDFSELERFRKIFILVSGGIDSTYLYELIKEIYPSKAFPVNCLNPYETSETLNLISRQPNFISIKPDNFLMAKKKLIESFLKLPDAFELKRRNKYHKKIFPCCYYLKHKMFLKNSLFQEPDTVVISGIKFGDGKQRRIWLSLLKRRDVFFHTHKTGQRYCYPFRDYTRRELPTEIIMKLRKIYPNIKHSGCRICPILILFNIKDEGKRYWDSVRFANRILKYPCITKWLEIDP